MKARLALAGLLVASLAMPHDAGAQLFRRSNLLQVDAHGCQILAPRDESKETQFRYMWHGPCSNGLANGRGWLVRYVVLLAGQRPYNPHTVWNVSFRNGRMAPPATEYGTSRLWTVWSRGDMNLDDGDGWPLTNRGFQYGIPRYMLPPEMQEALNLFAAKVPISGHVSMPVERDAVRCPGEIQVPAASGQTVVFDVLAFLRTRGKKQADQDLLHKMSRYDAWTVPSTDRDRNLNVAFQRIAAAVAGCS